MRHRVSLLLCSVFMIAAAPTAAADPITAVYQVMVVQRWDYRAQAIEPFHSSFELTLSFDSASVARPRIEGVSRVYGPPTFSGVPAELFVASPPAGSTVIQHRTLVDERWGSGNRYFRQSVASVLLTDDPFGHTFLLGTILAGHSNVDSPFASPPALTTTSMLEFFGSGPFNFLFGGYVRGASGFEPGSFQYQGEATLLRFDMPGGEPIPEPASFLLLGSGLAGLAVRRRLRAQHG